MRHKMCNVKHLIYWLYVETAASPDQIRIFQYIWILVRPTLCQFCLVKVQEHFVVVIHSSMRTILCLQADLVYNYVASQEPNNIG